MSRESGWWAGHLDELRRSQAAKPGPYLEFLRSEALSAGLYVLAEGGDDRQRPHEQDEVYYVCDGEAIFDIEGTEEAVRPGSVLFVRAGVAHRFRDIRSGLTVLVLFAPAETETTPG